MEKLFEQYLAAFFPVAFVAMWLVVTTILSVLSGWFWLGKKFPDQPEHPVVRLRGQSGAMGPGVSMQGILTLGVCATGLRVGINRLFGPFCGDFFVPWQDITVTRSTFLLRRVAKLRFGQPSIGSLTIESHVADRLARSSGGRWPEAGPFPDEKPSTAARRLAIEWAVATALAAVFFIFGPKLISPDAQGLPIASAVLFPATVFGIDAIVRYLRRKS